MPQKGQSHSLILTTDIKNKDGECRENKTGMSFKLKLVLSIKSLGQRSVEDGRRGAFNNEELLFHRETVPAAAVHTNPAMEMKDFEVHLRSYQAFESIQPSNTS